MGLCASVQEKPPLHHGHLIMYMQSGNVKYLLSIYFDVKFDIVLYSTKDKNKLYLPGATSTSIYAALRRYIIQG